LCRQIKQLFGLAPLAASFGVFRRVSVAKVNQNLTLRGDNGLQSVYLRQSEFVQQRNCDPFLGLKGLDKPIVGVSEAYRLFGVWLHGVHRS
jgi:hypothetical protein